MKKARYTLEQVAFGLRRAEEGTPVVEVCRKMGVNPTEGQLFTYTFTLPANPRKFLNQLKKGKGLLKTCANIATGTRTRDQKNTNKQSAPPTERPGAKASKLSRPKQTTEDRREYYRVRNQEPERKEYKRQHRRKQNQTAKETGKCKDCSTPAIPGQTRCEACAEKHRQSRQKSDAAKRAREKVERELKNQESTPGTAGTSLRSRTR